MYRILIADDEAEMANTIRFALLAEGYAVDVVHDGESAFNAIAKPAGVKYSLLITDVQMPKLTGLGLLRQLRQLENDTPVIVMTGFGDKQMVVDLMRIGCDDYIDKPFSIKEMVAMVARVFENENSVDQKREKEKNDQEREIQKYRAKFDEISHQITTAEDAFNQIMTVDTSDLPLDLIYRYRPFAGLGGDLICVGTLPDKSEIAILIADVAGHDIGASYHAVFVRSMFEEHCRLGGEITSFFHVLNEKLIHVGSEKMVTAQLVHINTKTNVLTLGNAGHWPMIRVNPLGEPSLVSLDGDVLGIRSDASFSQLEIPVSHKEKFYLCTDGFVELKRVDPTTGHSVMLSPSGVLHLLANYPSLPLEEQIEAIWKNALSFSNYRMYDDILLIGFQTWGANHV